MPLKRHHVAVGTNRQGLCHLCGAAARPAGGDENCNRGSSQGDERVRQLRPVSPLCLCNGCHAKRVAIFFVVGREGTRELWGAAATNLGEPSQLPPGTFLNKSSPGFGPIF